MNAPKRDPLRDSIPTPLRNPIRDLVTAKMQIAAMQAAVDDFYYAAVYIGNHPFIEFAGLISQYVQVCRVAQAKGIDFTQCNAHTGKGLPWKSFQIDYINKQLECIFPGLVAMKPKRAPVVNSPPDAVSAKEPAS